MSSPLSSRIISAERLRDAIPFRLAALGRDAAAGSRRAAEPAPESVESIRAAAFEQGRRQGIDEGLAEAARRQQEAERVHAGTLGERIAGIVADFDASIAALDETLARRTLSLSLQIAAQVVRTHVETRPDAVLPPLREALGDLLDDARRLVIRVSPTDEAVVREALDPMIRDGRCDVRSDLSLAAGGCRIDSPAASIDATLETRWRHVLEAIGQSSDEALDTLSAEPAR